MRLTIQTVLDAIERIGPSTVDEFANHLSVCPKRMRRSVSQWMEDGKMTHDDSKPAKYRFRALSEIGRDELGCIRQALTPDPTHEEIRAACLEIQKTWSPQEEYTRRVNKTQAVEVQQTASCQDSFGGMDFS